MIKKYFTILFLVVVSGMFLSQCKKYPEDDVLIQWKKPEKRLLKGSPWEFKKFLINNVDMTTSFQSDSAGFRHMYFTEDPTLPSCTIGGIPGRYELLNETNNILIQELSSNTPTGMYYFLYEGYTWEIKKLTKNHFIFQTNITNEIYRLELERYHQ